jgi:hypothetical protein
MMDTASATTDTGTADTGTIDTGKTDTSGLDTVSATIDTGTEDTGTEDYCADSPCEHGDCENQTDSYHCACYLGYTGTNCSACDSGYQDNDMNGTCRESCAVASLECGEHRKCDDGSGLAICVCQTGYTGDTCDACATDYQDNDNNGTCELSCEGAGLNCGPNANCEDISGPAACVCYTGYAGADCLDCESGYQDNDLNGTCLKSCAVASLECGEHGECDDETGLAICACENGYAGDACGRCADHYQDNNYDGICKCAEGYQDNDNDGICEIDNECCGEGCINCIEAGRVCDAISSTCVPKPCSIDGDCLRDDLVCNVKWGYCVVAGCEGKPDFTRCNYDPDSSDTDTDYDRSYDICSGGTCVSPGCGTAACNVPGPSFPLADSGQITCFNGEGALADCADAGDYYGQDAQYGWDADPENDKTRNRFIRNVDMPDYPFVVDNVTELIWQGCHAGLKGINCSAIDDSVESSQMIWTEAVAYCDGLTWGGGMMTGVCPIISHCSLLWIMVLSIRVSRVSFFRQ